MKRRGVFLLALATGLLTAADKKDKIATAGYSNDDIEVAATVYVDKTDIRALLGADPAADIAVVELKIAPKGEKKPKIYRDDFILLSHKDGQRSGPFDPAQIAGRGALVVSQTSRGGGGIMGQESGPVWGGIPGTGGRPSRMPGSGGAIGNVPEPATTQTEMKSAGQEKENPLLATLKKKGLPEKELEEPISGLLYFPLEGKHKPKDLSILYKGPAGRFTISFQP